MTRIVSAFTAGFIFCLPYAILPEDGGGSIKAMNRINDKVNEESDSQKDSMKSTLIVSANGDTIVFELNASHAAKDLYRQLPLSIMVENYSNNEKIFHPPEKLSTDATPLVNHARPGTLAYYAPWGNVVMFYGSFGSAPGLYELGHVMSGKEHIHKLSGTMDITKGGDN
jgi:hypothetical protein